MDDAMTTSVLSMPDRGDGGWGERTWTGAESQGGVAQGRVLHRGFQLVGDEVDAIGRRLSSLRALYI